MSISEAIQKVEARYAHQPEFIQAVKEVVAYLRGMSPIWRELVNGQREFIIQ